MITKEYLENRIEKAKATKKNLKKKKELTASFSVGGLINYCDETITICKELLRRMK